MLNNSIKATIKKFEDGHREMWIGDCPIWGFKDVFNVHDILNKRFMIKCLTKNYPLNNNNMCFLQEEYPEVSVPKNRIKTKESAKILNLKYDEGTEYFYGDIASTNQNFIDCVELMKRLPRIHPAYLGTGDPTAIGTKNELLESDVWKWQSKTATNFDELLFWLAEFDLSHIPLDIEEVEDAETPTPKNNDECHPHPLTKLKTLNPVPDIGREDTLKERLEKSEESRKESNNEKATLWETMRTGINTTLDSFCDKLISNSIVGGSCERSGSLRRITLGEKTIDIINEFDTDLDNWVIFIGDLTRPRILIDTNGDITADISAFIPDPLCMRDIQNLCDMLGVCRNNNWQVKEDTHEEQMESCETSDDKEDISKLIPKEELMKIIFENIKGILENDLSNRDKYPGKYHRNSWSLTTYEDLFRYAIFDRQRCMSKSIGCNLNKDHWEIYVDNASNVNIVVYPDEACWMTDALLFRTPNKDFPKNVLENIIADINTWIKTKTMPNKELSAFSQSLIKDGKRPTKDDYYLAMAEVASTRGTCLRRRFGSVIVKDDRIVSTGYAGAPSGRQNCCDIGYCFREHNNIPHGAMYERCRSSHSEMNAIINASKEEMKGATLYLVGVEPDGSYTNSDCCSMCKRVIINSGIEKVIAKQKNGMYNIIPVKEWIEHDDSLDINHKGY